MNKKITLLSAALMLLSHASEAVDYPSLFGQKSTHWIFEWSNIWPGPVRDSLYVDGETVVNGQTYRKLSLKVGHYPGGLIREDVATGKVYYKDAAYKMGNNPIDTTERILFDFNLQTGDTFQNMTVDSVKIVNGLKHIYFDDVQNDEPYTVIEGVGSNRGLLWRRGTGGMLAPYLLCSYKDDEKTAYSNLRYEGKCDFPTSIGNVPDANKTIGFYPNPAQTSIHISNESGKPLTGIRILGLDGRLYKEAGKGISEVSLTDLPKGYYFIQLSTEDFSTTKPLTIQ